MVPTEAFLYGLEADEELASLDLASRVSSCTRVFDPEDVAASVLYAQKQPPSMPPSTRSSSSPATSPCEGGPGATSGSGVGEWVLLPRGPGEARSLRGPL